MDVSAFISKWSASSGSERANKDAFLLELCDLLDVPRPQPTTGRPDDDTYVFEKDAPVPLEDGGTATRKIDLYKAGCFILEAKQGSDETSRKLGTARRGTPGWNMAMRGAFGQAQGYAHSFDVPVPFLVVCDIGYCFDLYATFDGSFAYRHFPNAQNSRIFLRDLEKKEHRETLRRIFLDPRSLDPSLHSAKVTRKVAEKLAELAKRLEEAGHPSEAVAQFLMRCLFTMFSEDVGLLPDNLFTKELREHWRESPASFAGGIEHLWQTMNSGGSFGFMGKILRFNGGLFVNPTALPMSREHLELLLEAASYDWSEVEPAIFGTLIERALDPKERHALGAHYTPRAYVERLVKPTIEEPLRADWDLVQAEARQLVASDKVDAAKKAVREFHRKLCATKVLDPACGSGNFLYVTLDLFKRLESEVLSLLEGLGEKQTLLHAETIRVTPGQFLGIEIKPWAKKIAELVLWIGYLQHHYRTQGKAVPPPEPVLQDYRNIERRDAVLAYDGSELVRDEEGKVVTRWDGETYKKSPVTGEDVPDESARVPVYKYVNPGKAEWPKADFIVGNPPFLGNKRMRLVLGDGYTEALRGAYPDVPESADFVMYWWAKAAALVRSGDLRRFGLITTNSITQGFSRRVVEYHLASNEISLAFAVPDHPWVDAADGAAVRIAMTVGLAGKHAGVLSTVSNERPLTGGEVACEIKSVTGIIRPALTIGADVSQAVRLSSNTGLACPGVQLSGQGFVLTKADLSGFSSRTKAELIKPYFIGNDLVKRSRDALIIDAHALREDDLRNQYPDAYQWLFDRVRPERAQNPREKYRREWWVFSEPRKRFRVALTGLPSIVATCRTAKHRVYTQLPAGSVPETTVIAFAVDDPLLFIGLLSSQAHEVWVLAAGGRLGVGNDPRYNVSVCFDPFPFPTCTESQSTRIRNLAESLDAHRKRQQSLHPNLTITGMYNVLEKLRSGEALSAKEKVIHEEGLVSVLRQIHDELDAAVFDAYGWPHDLSDEEILEKLVALNAERAAEERQGLVRWLRPAFQNPTGHKEATQVSLVEEDETLPDAPKTAPAWPKKLPEQIALVRDWLSRNAKSGFSVRELSKAFKGGKAKEVELVLDSLAALGIAIGYEKDGERRWRGATRGGGVTITTASPLLTPCGKAIASVNKRTRGRRADVQT